MRASLIASLCLGLSFVVVVFESPATAARVPGPGPARGVLDEPGKLEERGRLALEKLFAEHERLTGEQIVVAVFDGLAGEDAVNFTRKTFKDWSVGLRGKNNGLLLALYWNDQKARVEAGFGLDLTLPEGKADLILEDFLFPELRGSKVYRGLSLASLEILRVLESPLLEGGKAREILTEGGFEGPWEPARRQSADQRGGFVIAVMLAGLVLALAVLNHAINAAIHYTSKGWFREPLRAPRLRRPAARTRSSAEGASGSW